MGSQGPGDKPAVVRRRARRNRKPRRPSAAQVQQQAANAAPLSRKPVRPKTVRKPPTARQVQQQAAQARPLSQRPTHPQRVRPPRTARPLASEPPQGVKAGKRVVDAKDRRGVAVAAYNQLSGAGKRGHLAGAEKRARQGKATEGDKAILHAHSTRVAGNRKRVAAVAAFDAIAGNPVQIAKLRDVASRIEDSPFTKLSSGTDKIGLKPGETYGPANKKGQRPILSSSGKKIGMAAPLERPNTGSVANLPSVGKVIAALGPAATKGLERTALPKFIKNIPKDAAELAVTSPSALAKSTVEAVKHPRKEGEALVGEYKKLAKDPKKFISEKPVTAALMLQPGARAPGLVAGKAARLAGAQTLARESATLPNTALREVRTKSRAAGRNIVQTRADRRAVKAGRPPVVTARQVDTRVDESYAAAQKHTERVKGSIMRRAKKSAKKVPKADRKEFLAAMQEEAQSAATASARRRTAKEFGATHHVDETGAVKAQPHQTEGAILSEADAQKVADHLNEQNQTIPKGYGGLSEGHIAGRKYRNEPVPVKYVVRDAGHDKFAVVPQQVSQRLNLHSRIGKERAVPAILMRQSRKAFSKTVLPTRPSWLSGQAIEGTVRSAVARAGPLSYARTARLARRHPELYGALEERAVPGGVLGRAAAHEIADRTLNEEFRGESDLARRLTEWGKTPGVKQTRAAYDAYTRFVFDKVNGKGLEGIPQKAMLGRALKQSPLMDRHFVGLSNKAIDEAARGLKNTETQAHLAREVVRSYGKYAGFSPRLRSLIVHWTPFLPWYLNTAKFLTQTLPRDHPMMAALMADMSSATEDWRKQQGLSLRYKNENSLPGWMLGGYPIQGGKNMLRIGHYLPSGTVEPASDITGLILPQFSSAYGAVKYGKDWKGDDLKHPDGTAYNDGEKFLYAVQQMMEAMVPLYGQGTQILQSDDRKGQLLKSIRPVGTVAVHRDRGPAGGAPDLGGLELSPLQIQQIETGG